MYSDAIKLIHNRAMSTTKVKSLVQLYIFLSARSREANKPMYTAIRIAYYLTECA